MNTPQEEAKEIICRAENQMAFQLPTHGNQGPVTRNLCKVILIEELPLAELIAVARAASSAINGFDAMDIDYLRSRHNGTAAGEICSGDTIRLYDSLQALRATGKVEL